MAINERLVHTASAAAASSGNQEEGLILHLDANDVDSYDGDGSEWVDIANHEYKPTTNVSEHFNTVIWSGDGASTKSITGVGFQPDLVWVKARQAQNHTIYDSVRGTGKYLASDGTTAETTSTTYGQLTYFDSDGFTGSEGSNQTYSFFNSSSQTYVAWCFKAGELLNKSAEFNGSSSTVSLPGTPLNSLTSITYSAWVYYRGTGSGQSYGHIISGGSTSNQSAGKGLGIAVRNSDDLLYIWNTGGSLFSTTTLPENQWSHIALTNNAGAAKLYLNGAEVFTTTLDALNFDSSGNIIDIGEYFYSGTHHFYGSISQVRIFTSALTSSQITQLYNETPEENNGHLLGCVAAYPLGENANDVGGLYNGTASNVTFGLPGYANRNNEGTIESTVSANNDLGFSIVKYTGTTGADDVGHGLDVAPDLVIAKTLDSSDSNSNWIAYASPLSGQRGILNGTQSFSASTTHFRADPDSAVLKLSSDSSSNVNRSGDEHIAYCFASKRGVSKVGSYTGTGAAGNKVYTGFEPAFVMVKSTSFAERWAIYDNKRSVNDPRSKVLAADRNDAEIDTIYYNIDFDRDGFTVNGTANFSNKSGESFIYYAVAKDTNAGSLTPSTDGTEIETDLIFDPTKVNYYGNYAFEQNNTVWRGNSSKSNGQNEGEVYVNNYFESGDTGKYYFEVKCLESSGHGGLGFTDPTKYTGGDGASQTSFRNNQLWGLSAGGIQTGGYASITTFANSTNNTNEVTAIAIDVATRKVWMGRVLSGSITWYNSGDPSGGTNPLVTLPSNYNIYQPLAFDGSWSGSSARYAFWKIHTEAEASSLPTGFSYMTGAIKNADLELHLDAGVVDSTSSNWQDLSSNDYTATFTGITYDEELGNSYNFVGGSSEVLLNDGGSLTNNANFTVEMWLNSTDNSNYQEFWGSMNNAGGARQVYARMGIDDKIEITAYSTNNSNDYRQVKTTSVVGSKIYGKWTHLSIVMSSQKITGIYINGESEPITTTSGDSHLMHLTSTTNFGIGGWQNTGTGVSFNGDIGQVRMYHSALTQDQIRQNYNFTKPSYPNGFDAALTNMSSSDFDPSDGHFTFSADNDRMQTSFQPNVTVPFTASVWVKRNSGNSGYKTVIDYTQNASPYNGFGISHSGTGDYGMAINGGTDVTIGPETSGFDHLVFVYNGGTSCKTYINGVGTTRTLNNAIAQPNTSTNFVVGNSYVSTWSSSRMDVSDVKFYDRALTDDEVTAQHGIGYNGIG